jgi:hypothetical protein
MEPICDGFELFIQHLVPYHEIFSIFIDFYRAILSLLNLNLYSLDLLLGLSYFLFELLFGSFLNPNGCIFFLTVTISNQRQLFIPFFKFHIAFVCTNFEIHLSCDF